MQLKLEGTYITLSKLLKITGIIDTGGQAKWFLEEKRVYVNGEIERRRGRKLYDGDSVRYDDNIIVLKAD